MSHSEKVERGLTRGQVLRGGAALVAGTSLAGCDVFSTEPSGKNANGNGGGKGTSSAKTTKEAPALAQQVKAGRLPALKDRLPAQPLVVQPEESVGIYGGTWSTTIMSVSADAAEYIGYDGLVRWDPKFTKVIPNAAEWEISDDGRVYTFRLREGMKWSDGQPFTVDDVQFVFDDVFGNTDLFTDFPTWLSVKGKRATFEKVDRLTFTITFPEPNGMLLGFLADNGKGGILTSVPKHHFRQFHKKYNSDAEQQAKSQDYDSWADLFTAKGGLGVTDTSAWQNPDLPTLLPWRVTHALAGSSQRIVNERNPYYWKTDPEGRQLPYIDRVDISLVEDPEVLILQISQGRYSLPSEDVEIPRYKPVLARSRDKGTYHFIDLVTSDMNYTTLSLNQTCENKALREVFQNKDFRIGLSYAINRPEVTKAVYLEQGESWQSAPLPEGPYYDEQLAKQYTEFDLDKAQEHLDRSGYTRRDSAGYRQGPDGKRIVIKMVTASYDESWPDMGDIIKGYWKKVGIELQFQKIDDTLFFNRVAANKVDSVMFSGEAGLLDALYFPRWYFPWDGMSVFGLQWAVWYGSQGADGEEPPSAPKRQMELYDQIQRTVDTDQQTKLFMELLSIAREEFYVIGTVRPLHKYAVVKNTMHNVMNDMPEAGIYPDPAPARPEQYYLTGGS